MSKHYLITGGAGFIGSNYVQRLLERGEQVTIYDNLSRPGAALNLNWLRQVYGGGAFELITGDVRDGTLLTATARNTDVIVHLAGQVAVTSSITHPREDFECNALGTFNVLEAARLSERHPIFLYASTNKVYGGMEQVQVVEKDMRYEYADYPLGMPESLNLDFHSPYGCSKGSGDQYVRDYFRIYGLPTVVFRQSCIYGPRQFGVEDQGWLAWFMIAAITQRAITIYGNGKQVRDVLHVYDLLDVYDLAVAKINTTAGQVYNIGGGAQNTISIWKEFSPKLERLLQYKIPVSWGDWRPGDQPVYISDIRKAEKQLGWKPKIKVDEGLQRLYQWVVENRQLFT